MVQPHMPLDQWSFEYLDVCCTLVARDHRLKLIRIVYGHPLNYQEAHELVRFVQDHGCRAWISEAALVIGDVNPVQTRSIST